MPATGTGHSMPTTFLPLQCGVKATDSAEMEISVPLKLCTMVAVFSMARLQTQPEPGVLSVRGIPTMSAIVLIV